MLGCVFVTSQAVSVQLPDIGSNGIHVTTSVTSMQTTLYHHESRDVIRNAVNASEHDSVLFTGQGCTGAVHKLVNALKSTLEKYRLVTI
jgi:selenocysteine lyase/cysteine desulfurase